MMLRFLIGWQTHFTKVGQTREEEAGDFEVRLNMVMPLKIR